ncbi:hypothetical protein GCM10027164_25550 [Algoriphagus taiwanensis]
MGKMGSGGAAFSAQKLNPSAKSGQAYFFIIGKLSLKPTDFAWESKTKIDHRVGLETFAQKIGFCLSLSL